ncbi:methyltransferase family protein [Hephaestia caeni]|uniref:Methyltransferase family protein n=1 Tax=Hephaestia caeni TaxID=645617 RepID=A0A397ND15_9SPHN|nr:class I SAM-dependent methyltransferase [Hephaestia caeni]RIA35352.1 methyltransferase family protein [Hephaestia caeni]
MAKETPADLRQHFSPESRFGGFSEADAMIEFYGRIAALVEPTSRILDYGAGRGAQIAEDALPYRRALKTLKGRVAHVEGCDIDPEVMKNPYLDAAKVFDPTKPLPYDDDSFDLVYSNWVFEHVANPDMVARELLRVVKPGGYICALTPNRWGYIAVASRLVGNRNHVPLLRRIQPNRKEFDVFPTLYRLNTPNMVKRHFGHAADIVVYAVSGDPAYHFQRPTIYKLFQWIHRLTPKRLQPLLLIFARKQP